MALLDEAKPKNERGFTVLRYVIPVVAYVTSLFKFTIVFGFRYTGEICCVLLFNYDFYL